MSTLFTMLLCNFNYANNQLICLGKSVEMHNTVAAQLLLFFTHVVISGGHTGLAMPEGLQALRAPLAAPELFFNLSNCTKRFRD